MRVLFMKAILFVVIPAFLIGLTCIQFAVADNCRNVVRQNAVVLDTGLAIVPYAIPVAVPVVPTTQGLYSYNSTAAAYRPQVQAASNDALFQEFMEWRAKRAAVTAQAEPVSPFAQTCLKCHSSGGTGFAHHDFSKPLTSDDKLAAIDAIVQGTMPPKRTLDPQVRADIVAELSKREKQVKAAVVPPQPQGESK